MSEKRKNEYRWDRYGEFRSMAFAENYVMCRRKGRTAVVMTTKEWDALARAPDLVVRAGLKLIEPAL